MRSTIRAARVSDRKQLTELLGIRPHWRKQGLGEVMLQYAFARLK